MANIQVTKIQESLFEVTVAQRSITTHQVTVQPDYALTLTRKQISVEELVRKSFEFLLQRESNTSILRSFDLSVIARYFPEYEREISL